MKFAITLGLLCVVLPRSDGMRECMKIKKVAPFAEEFIRNGKFHFAFHSDCTNCEAGDEKWKPFQGRTVPKTVCYKLGGDMMGKPFYADFECTYSTSGQGGCVLLPGKSDNRPFGGDLVLTKTDNKTYIAGVMCVFGYDQFFWVASTEDKSADTKFKKKMLKHFKDLGFEVTKLADKDGPLVLKTVAYHQDKC